MTLFEQILAESNLLLEKQNDVTIEKIKDAIENQRKVSIMYNDKQGGGGKSWRYILPVVYGELKNGKAAIRAYETVGSTKRGLRPDVNHPDGNPWKLFLLDRIVAWYNQDKNFTEQDLGPLFNKTGDKGFSTIIYHFPGIEVSPEQQQKQEPEQVPVQEPTVPKEPEATIEPNVDNIAGQSATPDWKNQYNQEKGQGISIDNNGNVAYNKDIEKINAPETTPVTKGDITPEPQVMEPQQTTEPEVANDEPVEKTDVQPQNDITPAYRDLMYR